MITQSKNLQMIFCTDRLVADSEMLRQALPPADGQRCTLLVCKTRFQSENLWRMTLDATMPDRVEKNRNSMRWGDNRVVFGSADFENSVHAFSGMAADVLCISGITDFTDRDLGYLLHFNRSSNGFMPKAYATL